MKPTKKFPYEIDPTEPRVFDRIIEVAARMRVERRGRLLDEIEERRLAQHRALTALRQKEAIEAAREAARDRQALLARMYLPATEEAG
jgi:hypothetical protein